MLMPHAPPTWHLPLTGISRGFHICVPEEAVLRELPDFSPDGALGSAHGLTPCHRGPPSSFSFFLSPHQILEPPTEGTFPPFRHLYGVCSAHLGGLSLPDLAPYPWKEGPASLTYSKS